MDDPRESPYFYLILAILTVIMLGGWVIYRFFSSRIAGCPH